MLPFGKGTTTTIYCHTFQQAQARAGDAIAKVLDFKKKKPADKEGREHKIKVTSASKKAATSYAMDS